MAILQWFDSSKAVDFAQVIAADITKQFPPDGVSLSNQFNRPKDKKKLEKILVRIFQFSEKNPLNFYTKAKFLKALMSELQSCGHDEVAVNKIIEVLAVRM